MILGRLKNIYAIKLLGLFLGIFIVAALTSNTAYATSSTTTTAEDGNTSTSSNLDTLSPSNSVGGLNISYDSNGEGGLSANIKILLFFTVISLAPSILIMMTSFTRIIIVLHFTRAALNTQTAPPNQVLAGLALFLTLFIMGPIFTQINDTAIKPLDAGQITQEQALEIGLKPLREFMFKQTKTKDIKLFLDIAQITNVEDEEDIPITVLIPSFIISELRSAFIMGFLIYIPFIIIDMVVASTLMSMGMMMLPPTTISMPFKILLFVLADGWNLIIGNLVKTFY
ncbi:MAG: flagellar type III secretion system pore protein FliP [Lachnotalea sp.]